MVADARAHHVANFAVDPVAQAQHVTPTRAKTCSTCRTEKPMNFFNRDKSTTDGWARACRGCMKAARAQSIKRVAARNHYVPESAEMGG